MTPCLTPPVPVIELFVQLDKQQYHYSHAEPGGKVVVKNEKGDVVILYVDAEKKACVTLRAKHDSI